MGSSIGKRLTAAIEPVCPLYLIEADSAKRLPYAVYKIDETPSYSKDGVYKWGANVTILIGTASYDDGAALADRIDEIIAELRSDSFLPILNTKGSEKDSSGQSGFWIFNREYYITEFV